MKHVTCNVLMEIYHCELILDISEFCTFHKITVSIGLTKNYPVRRISFYRPVVFTEYFPALRLAMHSIRTQATVVLYCGTSIPITIDT